MKFKIISDSSCNLDNDYIKNEFGDSEIGFETVPFVVILDGKEYVDDGSVTAEEMMKHLKTSKETNTSCPSPFAFEKTYTAEYNFVVTVGSKLSGSYQSAVIASQNVEGKKVFVIDSKGAGGATHILIDKLYKYIKKGYDYETIQKKITRYRDIATIYMTLSNYDNFIKKGRIKPFLAKLLQVVGLKVMCRGNDGELVLDKKFLSFASGFSYLKKGMLAEKDEEKDTLIITCCGNDNLAQNLKNELTKLDVFKKIVVNQGKILHSFFALENSFVVVY